MERRRRKSGLASPAWMQTAETLCLGTETLPPALPEGAPGLLDGALAREFSLVPLGRADDGRIMLACASPELAQEHLAELEFALGPVRLSAAEPSAVHALIARHYAGKSLPEMSASPELDAGLPTETLARLPGVATYVDSVIAYAVRMGSSDVHFEPLGDEFRVRLRVDGALRQLPGLPSAAGPAVLARLKVLAGMDLGLSRRAQDGRIANGTGTDLRLATLPAVGGECAVLRLLDAARQTQDLAALGMPPACRELLENVCKAQGLVLACGPTGSGKTTTLHAALRSLNAGTRKILTIEDPVEYELAGAVQVQARPEIGLGFARALRSFLRHDPDVILVGEIRDAETARIALRAALTGHLVLASLHCQDAAQAPLRLVELGLEPWLVGAALELAIAQRLLRKTCQACCGKGCAQCAGTGYAGRVAVFEWLRMTPALGAKLDEGLMGDFLSAAREAVRIKMARSGKELARQGLTTDEELAAQLDIDD
ncbi:MAG: GspE/PulE family protein [Opitutales bacterium]|jgi:type II secretory ATPase GspE/PulE/Tfp pilus assembly ATPase PilB-like protein